MLTKIADRRLAAVLGMALGALALTACDDADGPTTTPPANTTTAPSTAPTTPATPPANTPAR